MERIIWYDGLRHRYDGMTIGHDDMIIGHDDMIIGYDGLEHSQATRLPSSASQAGM